MILTRLTAANWRNFRKIDVPLEERIFAVGPNAGGKSNFLDLFRFLNELVIPGGGLHSAMQDRGGIPALQCRISERNCILQLSASLSQKSGTDPEWRYELGIFGNGEFSPHPTLAFERVWRGSEKILDRPNADDLRDPLRMEQTFLENVNTNEEFRPIAQAFRAISYTHLMPQSTRRESRHGGGFLSAPPTDPSTRDLVKEVLATPVEIRAAKLKKIEAVLRLAVPQLERMGFSPHQKNRVTLEVFFEHWREGTTLSQEFFSDGTIRLISILWALLETEAILLLEEPELSLHPAVVRHLPGLIYRLKRHNPGQVIVTTHSVEMLADPGIDGREVLVFLPDAEGGATVVPASDLPEIQALLSQGMSIGDIVLPRSQPSRIEELGFFE